MERSTRYTCPHCYHVTLEVAHLDRVLCAHCGRTMTHDLPLSRAATAYRRTLELADTQPLPVIDDGFAVDLASVLDKSSKS